MSFLIFPGSVTPAAAQVAAPYPDSGVIDSINWDFANQVTLAPGSDLWPITWAGDGNLYTSWGDGGGFGGDNSDGRVSLGFARIEGDPSNFVTANVWGGKNPENPAQFGGKCAGMAAVDGVLYAWCWPQDASPVYTKLFWSSNMGATWQQAGWNFGQQDTLRDISFLQFGQDYSGARDQYVYSYALERGGSSEPNGLVFTDGLALLRVPRTEILNRNSYEFFAGLDDNGNPLWSSDIAQRQPVFDDPNGVALPAVSYVPGLGRYILTTAHGAYAGGISRLGVFDAAEPWGPWTTAQYNETWGGLQGNWLAYYIPTKSPGWLSPDGQSFYLVYSGVNYDQFNLVKATLTLKSTDTTPPTVPTSLSATAVSQSQIDLTWAAASDPESGVVSYNVYRDVGITPVGTSATTSFQDTGLAANTTYSYQVAAVNGAGLEGSKSASASATTLPLINQAPIVSASGDAEVSLTAAANFVGMVTDDGLPNPPGSVTTNWSEVSGPTAGATVTFGTPAALTTTATFSEVGVYVLKLTADDSQLAGSDQVSITVLSLSVLTSIAVDPAAAMVLPGGSVKLTAPGLDQHGNSFPINATWAVDGGGTIDQTGLFTAGTAEGGPFTVTAVDGLVSGTGSITVVGVVAELVVSNLTVASGNAYQVMAGGLNSGAEVYIDRSFTLASIPASLQGTDYVQTANGDKNATQETFLTVTVNQDVTVFVGYDSRATSLPNWLAPWTNIGESLVSTDVPLNLYSKNFPAGPIALGANFAAGASGAGSNYTVAFVGQGNTINQPPVVNAGPDQSAKLMSPTIVALNGSVSDDDLPNPPAAVTSEWLVLSGPVGSTVAFADSTNPVTFASFSDLGVYTLSLSANDGEFITTDEVVVTVLDPETLTSITLNQAATNVMPGGSVQFTASGLDQYGSSFPTNPTWEVSGGGSIDQSGLFIAGAADGGPYTVTASEGLVSGTGSITVAGVVAQLEVSDLTVASGKAYQVVDGLSVGSPVYIDRGYTYTGVPAVTDGALYIRTANNDKNRTETSFLTFSVNGDVTAYVGYDSRATSLPGWLSGWVNTGQALANTDVSLDLYSKDFVAGSITLGGNKATGSVGARSNYTVAIIPR